MRARRCRSRPSSEGAGCERRMNPRGALGADRAGLRSRFGSSCVAAAVVPHRHREHQRHGDQPGLPGGHRARAHTTPRPTRTKPAARSTSGTSPTVSPCIARAASATPVGRPDGAGCTLSAADRVASTYTTCVSAPSRCASRCPLEVTSVSRDGVRGRRRRQRVAGPPHPVDGVRERALAGRHGDRVARLQPDDVAERGAERRRCARRRPPPRAGRAAACSPGARARREVTGRRALDDDRVVQPGARRVDERSARARLDLRRRSAPSHRPGPPAAGRRGPSGSRDSCRPLKTKAYARIQTASRLSSVATVDDHRRGRPTACRAAAACAAASSRVWSPRRARRRRGRARRRRRRLQPVLALAASVDIAACRSRPYAPLRRRQPTDDRAGASTSGSSSPAAPALSALRCVADGREPSPGDVRRRSRTGRRTVQAPASSRPPPRRSGSARPSRRLSSPPVVAAGLAADRRAAARRLRRDGGRRPLGVGGQRPEPVAPRSAAGSPAAADRCRAPRGLPAADREPQQRRRSSAASVVGSPSSGTATRRASCRGRPSHRRPSQLAS